MKPEVKEKWLDALRSGKYKQGRFSLERDDKFCCLGVLCHIASEEGVIRRAELPLLGGVFVQYGVRASDGFLPSEVMDWAGLGSSDPTVALRPTGHFRLSNLNDRGDTFEEIADVIEEQL